MSSNLERFLITQQQYYSIALDEIRSGRKNSHWMWYIFPQIIGLGASATAKEYAIKDMKEAKEFLKDYTLKSNLVEISKALLLLESNNASDIMGYPDDMKLHSCMTLFALADKECDVFQKVLNKFFDGKKDQRTIDILKSQIADKN